MPDMTGYSIKEANIVLNKLGIKHKIYAESKVQSQSISPGTVITSDMEVELN